MRDHHTARGTYGLETSKQPSVSFPLSLSDEADLAKLWRLESLRPTMRLRSFRRASCPVEDERVVEGSQTQ
jgi:hypothetical protein